MAWARRPQVVFTVAQILFFACLTYQLAFIPLLCNSLGFSSTDIAVVVFVAALMKIFSPTLVPVIARRTGQTNVVLTIVFLTAPIAFMGLTWFQSFPAIVLLWGIASFCIGTFNASLTAMSIRDSENGVFHFERARSWGSLSFALYMFIGGAAIDSHGEQALLTLGNYLLWLTALSCIYLIYVRRHWSDQPPFQRDPKVGEEQTFNRTFLIILLVTGLAWAGHANLYVYLSVYLEALGWTGAGISMAWNVSVAGEVIFFLCFLRIRRYLSLVAILKLSLLATICRWIILYLFKDPAIIMASQALHAFSFGGLYLATMRLTFELLPDNSKDTGQGYLITAAGVGSLIGNALVGLGAKSIESNLELNQLFVISMVCTSAALLAAVVGLNTRRTSN